MPSIAFKHARIGLLIIQNDTGVLWAVQDVDCVMGSIGSEKPAWGYSAISTIVQSILGLLQLSIAPSSPSDSRVLKEIVHAFQLSESTRSSFSY